MVTSNRIGPCQLWNIFYEKNQSWDSLTSQCHVLEQPHHMNYKRGWVEQKLLEIASDAEQSSTGLWLMVKIQHLTMHLMWFENPLDRMALILTHPDQLDFRPARRGEVEDAIKTPFINSVLENMRHKRNANY